MQFWFRLLAPQRLAAYQTEGRAALAAVSSLGSGTAVRVPIDADDPKDDHR